MYVVCTGIFLPTPSVRRATHLRQNGGLGFKISTHALREEGDGPGTARQRPASEFLPTPSVRRATCPPLTVPTSSLFLPTPSVRRATGGFILIGFFPPISTHALREEGDLTADVQRQLRKISTHALREEGDRTEVQRMSDYDEFLPTPSVRMATKTSQKFCGILQISTHALREEGDQMQAFLRNSQQISTHALREEGDRLRLHGRRGSPDFYPRPP